VGGEDEASTIPTQNNDGNNNIGPAQTYDGTNKQRKAEKKV
jgi:hypothetical protein